MSVAISETDMPIGFPLEIIPHPSHPVPLKEIGVFHMAQGHHDFTSEGSLTGYKNELKVGELISRIDFVREVRQVEPEGSEDKDLIDLVIIMVEGYPIPEVFIQVKSSRRSVHNFFNSVGKRLDDFDRKSGENRDKSNDDVEHQRRIAWMKANRLMVINGEVKKGRPVSDDYIIGKFMREVEAIIEHERTGHASK